MRSENAYFNELATFKDLLDVALSGDVDLPDILKPEHQCISASMRERASSMREAFLRGDRESIRKTTRDLAVSGFNRSSEEEDCEVEELREARDKVKNRRLNERENGSPNGSSRDSGDCGDSPA